MSKPFRIAPLETESTITLDKAPVMKRSKPRKVGRPKAGRKPYLIRMKPAAYKAYCKLAKANSMNLGAWLEAHLQVMNA